MRIKNLQLRASAVVEGFYNGLHRSPAHGFSVEFSEYRPYTTGDDPRSLDWKLFARTDRYYIKQFEDETNRRCYLLVDQSRSMSFGSLDYTKKQYAQTLAATLAYFLSMQRDSVGLMTFAGEVLEFIAARHRPGHFRQLLVALERSDRDGGTDISAPLEQLVGRVRRRGLVVLISDLLADVDNLRRNLSYLRAQNHEVMLLQTLDPLEMSLDLTDPSMFRDLESGRELYVDPDEIRRDYQRRFEEHQQRIEHACQPLGIRRVVMPTDQPLESALFGLLNTQTYSGTSAAKRARRMREVRS